jgi:hypothetical protein
MKNSRLPESGDFLIRVDSDLDKEIIEKAFSGTFIGGWNGYTLLNHLPTALASLIKHQVEKDDQLEMDVLFDSIRNYHIDELTALNLTDNAESKARATEIDETLEQLRKCFSAIELICDDTGCAISADHAIQIFKKIAKIQH